MGIHRYGYFFVDSFLSPFPFHLFFCCCAVFFRDRESRYPYSIFVLCYGLWQITANMFFIVIFFISFHRCRTTWKRTETCIKANSKKFAPATPKIAVQTVFCANAFRIISLIWPALRHSYKISANSFAMLLAAARHVLYSHARPRSCLLNRQRKTWGRPVMFTMPWYQWRWVCWVFF